MKREAFEDMLMKALTGVAEAMVDKPSSKPQGIGGLRFGSSEREVGNAVSRLTVRYHRANKPMQAPQPEMVPPCF